MHQTDFTAGFISRNVAPNFGKELHNITPRKVRPSWEISGDYLEFTEVDETIILKWISLKCVVRIGLV
jgi:hypothetical protein